MKCTYCSKHCQTSYLCKGCYLVQYCSKGCMLKHWRAHIVDCLEVKQSERRRRADDFYNKKAADTKDATAKPATTEDVPIKEKRGVCRTCKLTGELKVCRRCKIAEYCSWSCQKRDWTIHKKYCVDVDRKSPRITVCAYCGDTGYGLKRCTGCFQVRYCSRFCQQSHWSRHRQQCNPAQYAHNNEVPKVAPENKTNENDKERANEPARQGKVIKPNASDETWNRNEKNGSNNKPFAEEKELPTNKRNTEKVHNSNAHSTNTKKETVGGKPRDTKKDSSKSASYTLEEIEARKDELRSCHNCMKVGFVQGCSVCIVTKYCSRECQTQDWTSHKSVCASLLGLDGYIETERTQNIRLREKNTRLWNKAANTDGMKKLFENTFGFKFFKGGPTPDELLITARRPPGSLQRAKRLAKLYFPNRRIVDDLDDLPDALSAQEHTVFVVFMSRYHDNVMSHSIYLKDKNDNTAHAEFSLDCDIPEPHFRYSDIKPGAYICMTDLVRPVVASGPVEIEISFPWTVRVLENDILKER